MLCSFSSGGFAADTIFDAFEKSNCSKTTPTRPGAEGVALCHDKASCGSAIANVKHRGINTTAKQKDLILLENAMAAKRHLLVEN